MEQETIDQQSQQSPMSEKSLPNATATLVLGIISIVGCFLYGIPGIICGIIAIALFQKDKKLYLANPNVYAQSFKNAKAGNVCAIIGLSLSAFYFLLIVLAFGFAFSIAGIR